MLYFSHWAFVVGHWVWRGWWVQFDVLFDSGNEGKEQQQLQLIFRSSFDLSCSQRNASTWEKRKIKRILFYFIPTKINQVIRFLLLKGALQKLSWNLISENRLRVKYADSVGNKFLTNFYKANGKPLYIIRMVQKSGVFVCKHKHTGQITYVVCIYFYWKKERETERERWRRRQQQQNWINSIKSKVLRCAYLICFRDWTLAKLVRLLSTHHTSGIFQSMVWYALYNDAILSLCFTYLFDENRLEFILNFERPWKLNLLHLLRIEPTNPTS